MSYEVHNQAGDVLAHVDCIYDLNGMLGLPEFIEPSDGDLSKLEPSIEILLNAWGYSIHEIVL